MSGLDRPENPSSLYLARGTEVDPLRPVNTGDVFLDVPIPGVDDGAAPAIVVAHPCSMRAGPHLLPYMRMARIEHGRPISLAEWGGNIRCIPLPELLRADDFTARGVFELSGRVATSTVLDLPRVASMDAPGVLLLLQRMAYDMTRVAVDLETLLASVAHVFEELDLLEEWLDARVSRSQPPDALQRAIHQEEEAFENVMTQTVDGVEHRRRLRDPKLRAAVRRSVREALHE